VSHETTPEDFMGMKAAVGILTQTGGVTSHAAVVATGMDRVCVVGCTSIKFDDKYGIVFEGNPVSQPLKEGDVITIDGSNGNVYLGAVPMIGGQIPDFVSEMIEWGTEPGQVFSYDPLKDKLPSEGEVFIQCSGLNGSDLNTLNTLVLEENKNLHGVLLFEKPSKFDDSGFLTTLGISAGTQMTKDQYDALKKVTSKRWTVVGAPEHIHQANLYCKLHRKAKTLKDLMNAEGYYQLDKDLKELLSKQGVTIEEFADLLKKAGKNLKPLVTPVSRSELAFKVFGS
jgi:phosphohistidine swiveling domain-containing protein